MLIKRATSVVMLFSWFETIEKKVERQKKSLYSFVIVNSTSRMSSSTTTKKGETNDEENVTVEEIEQTCNRLSKYDPCFRLSFIQQEMKKFGISTNDERLVKMMSLSFETMVRRRNIFHFLGNSRNTLFSSRFVKF